jgi:signal transduction histidine kinase
MTADIAHELRTPLSVERAHLEALQDGIYPLTPENLGPILEQNGLLTRLVEDLRTLALADAGQLPMQRVPTDLPALLGRVVSRFEPQAITREIALELSPGPDARVPFPRLALDPARIEQLLGNLLANALRHTPVGGKIRLDISSSPAAVQVTVRDTGPGIPEDALPHIFERFYRADRARSRAEGGSGLGLAIARQIAQAHGGSLTAANHPQGGAIFTLSLPNLDCSEGP